MTPQEKMERAHALAVHAIRLRDAGLGDAALAVVRRAAAMAPDDAQVIGNLGNVLIWLGLAREGKAATERALELDPSLTALNHNLGLAFSRMGRYDDALREYAKVRDRFVDAAFDEAATLMLLGRWEEGWRALECRRAKNGMGARGMPDWDGKPFDGTLWVTAEQGQGDVIQFARYLPWAAGLCKRVVFDAPITMLSLLTGYPGVAELRPWEREGMPEPDADFHTPLMSLMMFHGTQPDAVLPDPGHFASAASQFPAQVTGDPGYMKVGICWAGNPGHLRDRDRSVSLETFLPLAGIDGVQLYSFQVGPHGRDVSRMGLDALFNDLSGDLTSWLRTAAALLRMDLVIAVDTAVAHLAAAMGVPTWIMIPKTPDWRWLAEGDTTPWYPDAVLYRQERMGEWDGPVRRIFHTLKAAVERYQKRAVAAAAD